MLCLLVKKYTEPSSQMITAAAAAAGHPAVLPVRPFLMHHADFPITPTQLHGVKSILLMWRHITTRITTSHCM